MADVAVTVRDEDPTVSKTDGVTKVQLDTTPTPEVKVDPSRPAWLPEKFKTPEDLAKSYGELEKKLGGVVKPEVVKTEGVMPQIKAATDATATIEAAGLDMAALRSEFATTGALSDKTYESLAAKNISRGDADAYIEGQKALVREYKSQLAASVGGDESLAGLLEWAGANVSKPEVITINKTLVSGDAELSKTVLAGLKARQDAAQGVSPDLVNGEGVRSPGVQPFASNDELVIAMQDPRYKRGDRGYHAEVSARIAAGVRAGR